MIKINNIENRAADKELELYENVGIIEGKGFDLAERKKGVEKFRDVCDIFSHSPDVKTITFQNGTRDDGLTFDKATIETLLFMDNNLDLICRSNQTDRAYFLFEMPIGGDFLLVVEKSRCDSVCYYDKRECTETEARRIIEVIEEDAINATRHKFRLIRSKKH